MPGFAKRFPRKGTVTLTGLSLIAAGILLLLPSLVLAASGDAGGKAKKVAFEETAALKQSQAAIGGQVRDHRFVDVNGKTVRMSDFAGKPLVISLIYTSCYNTCPQITQSLARGAEIASEALGEDNYNIVTIGFDTQFDKPSAMRSFMRQQDISDANWNFLSADVTTVWRLSDDLGFSFSPSVQGFDHLTQTTILDVHGRVFAQVYGDDFPVPQLVEPLKSLVLGDGSWKGVQGTLASIINSVRLACTVYDPQKDAYRFDYSIFIGMLIGFVCIAGTIAFVIREAWLGRRQRQAANNSSKTLPPHGPAVPGSGNG